MTEIEKNFADYYQWLRATIRENRISPLLIGRVDPTGWCSRSWTCSFLYRKPQGDAYEFRRIIVLCAIVHTILASGGSFDVRGARGRARIAEIQAEVIRSFRLEH